MSMLEQLGEFDLLRRDIVTAVKGLRRRLEALGLTNDQVVSRLSQVEEVIAADRLRVAFVAEFSRGKSELINALLFSSHGRRVLPSRTGRTTMCPTELEWFEGASAEVLLLPIDAARDVTLREARLQRDLWQVMPFDPDDTASVVAATERVSMAKRVTTEEAEGLGFRIDPEGENGLKPASDGTVEIPAWRHAIIRYPHPLLERGLVIVDTPGLNAIGAEIDLTLSLLPECQAVVFVLGVDTGVTRSDYEIWRRFLHVGEERSAATCLVVLNKIDSLEDGLRSAAEIEKEITLRVDEVAGLLNVPHEHIYPLSAQRALVGRVQNRSDWVEASRIRDFEQALSETLMDQRLTMVQEAVRVSLSDLVSLTGLNQRLQALEAQEAEIESLRGENRARLLYQLKKVQTQQQELAEVFERVKAAKVLFGRESRQLLDVIGRQRIRAEVENVLKELEAATFSTQMKKAIDAFFQRLDEWLDKGQTQLQATHDVLRKIYDRFAAEDGLEVGAPPAPPSYEEFRRDLQRVRSVALDQVSSWGTLFSHGRRQVIERFISLVGREVEARWERQYRQFLAWVRISMTPVDDALARRTDALEKRSQSLQRMQASAEALEQEKARLDEERRLVHRQIEEVKDALQRVMSVVS